MFGDACHDGFPWCVHQYEVLENSVKMEEKVVGEPYVLIVNMSVNGLQVIVSRHFKSFSFLINQPFFEA